VRRAVAVVALLLVPAVASGWWHEISWSGNRQGTGFDRARLPVDACAFLEDHDIEGRLLNSWNWGGYIAWATGQKVFVYSHGEVMTQDFFREYTAIRQPEGFAQGLAKWQPTVAVVPFTDSPYWLVHLQREKSWRRVYSDHQAAIYLRDSVAPQVVAESAPVQGVDYPTIDGATAQELLTRGIEAEPPGVLDWLRGRAAYPIREQNLSTFYLQIGELEASFATALEGLRQADFAVPDLLLNLGHAFNLRGLHGPADRCFDRFLELDDDPEMARSIEQTRNARR
jgi:hypothetical protein